ncbi:hypothetical protein GCM10023231_11490 [Olivibacter ginsenosidimutans]|uniref:Secretin/TonB short N-terminal domain-containing protein n=1 Tax=Olivibacter ginsenosidimutans TaxID=1176537 RepID=A0ABP9AT18_9SPHI
MQLDVYDGYRQPRTHGIQQLILKLLVLVLLIWNPVAALAFAQGITLTEKDASLKSVLEAIKKQSGYQLFYNDPMMREAKPVTLTVQEAPLKAVLDLCFAEQPLDYTIQKNVIVVKRKARSVVKPPQDLQVNGVVSDDNYDEPEETLYGQVSDAAGHPIQTEAGGQWYPRKIGRAKLERFAYALLFLFETRWFI